MRGARGFSAARNCSSLTSPWRYASSSGGSAPLIVPGGGGEGTLRGNPLRGKGGGQRRGTHQSAPCESNPCESAMICMFLGSISEGRCCPCAPSSLFLSNTCHKENTPRPMLGSNWAPGGPSEGHTGGIGDAGGAGGQLVGARASASSSGKGVRTEQHE